MDLQLLFADKGLKPKEKTEHLASMVGHQQISADDVMNFAQHQKDPVRATCIEALEFASKLNPKIMSFYSFDLVVDSLSAKAPRIKWEAAKVIGNCAALFSDHLDDAVEQLLKNTSHEGTVVRWSAAYALAEILCSDYPNRFELNQQLQSVCEREEKESIRKIYLKAFKKVH